MIDRILKTTNYDTCEDIYRFEKDYMNRTYSFNRRVDEEWLYEKKLSSYEQSVMEQFAKQASEELNAQILEQVYNDTGWVRIGRIKEDEHTLTWIRDNVRRGYSRLGNGVYYFENKDEAAWFRMMYS